MEHLVVCELIEKLSTTITDKLFQEVWLITTFKDDFEFICNEVNSINCLLTDAREKRTSHSTSLTNWLNELEDFLVDAEDIVEECEYRNVNFLKIIFSRYSMGHKIRKLKERITRIHKGAKYLKYLTSLNVNAGAHALEDERRKSNAFLSQFHSVGIEESIGVITNWIFEDGFRVIAVVGMGGLGKTYLVQDVFKNQKVRGHFDHLVWLTVSPNYVVRELLRTALSQIELPDDQKLSDLSEGALRERINNHLQEKNKHLAKKSYLFVLDDVWDRNVWTQIGLQLDHDNKNKNKVVVTTRDKTVAQAMGADADHTHHMTFLSGNNSWKLFCIHSHFPDNVQWNPPPIEDQRPTDVNSIAQRIVQKCSGLPLAIKTIGASMASVRRIPNEWELTLDRLNEAEPITENVMPSLRLSYDALPDPLKPCFLYFSAFPPNSEIKSEHLAYVWVAEGFISTSSKEAREATYEVARSYIDQLLGRCLLEGSLSVRHRRVKYCKMHELLHEFALVESGKEARCLLKPGQDLKELPLDECHGIRRISLVENSISTLKDPMPCTGLRTLLLRNNIKLASISSNFFDNLKYLTVLDLSQTSIESLPMSIGNLTRLKFLNLSETNIQSLPKSLSGLKRLQFLDVSRCQHLKSLHLGIEEHKFMAYLNVKGCSNLKSMPGGISKLIYLRTLKGALVFKRDQLKEANAALQWTDLKELTHLQHLSLTIDPEPSSKSQGEGRISLEGTFGGMRKMRTLSIRNISSSGRLDLPDDMKCMERLEIVRLRNCALPKWMFQFQNLMVLLLEGDNSSAEEYKGLQTITNLKELRLSRNNRCDQFPQEFGEEMAFPQLENLIMEDFDSLKKIDGSMPMLKYLQLKNCRRLEQMPHALQKLTSLKEIEVESCTTWENDFWSGVDRDSTWKILNERRIKLRIDNYTVSVERNIENDKKLQSAGERFRLSLTKNKSGRSWNLFSA